jgi:hypothetical protein
MSWSCAVGPSQLLAGLPSAGRLIATLRRTIPGDSRDVHYIDVLRIIIRMYLIDTQHHNLPHIHAKYAEFEASVGIGDGEVLAGELPRKQLRLV